MCYDITDDVIGWLDNRKVLDYLKKIKDLQFRRNNNEL